MPLVQICQITPAARRVASTAFQAMGWPRLKRHGPVIAMTQDLRALADEILRLQSQLDSAIVAVRRSGSVADGDLVNASEPKTGAQPQLQTRRGRALNLLVAPLIYSMVLPIALLDLWATLYQVLCFPVYGIAQVRRSAHVIIDHHKLQYLGPLEKLNCVYCGYANGVVSYVREIGGATEQYWCPIKHAVDVPDPHPRYEDFLPHGDADGYRSRLQQFRDRLAPGDDDAQS